MSALFILICVIIGALNAVVVAAITIWKRWSFTAGFLVVNATGLVLAVIVQQLAKHWGLN